MTFKLPEPTEYVTVDETPAHLYTEAQLKQALRDVLEQAAQMCEEKHWTWRMGDTSGPKECAIAIRKMIGEV